MSMPGVYAINCCGIKELHSIYMTITRPQYAILAAVLCGRQRSSVKMCTPICGMYLFSTPHPQESESDPAGPLVKYILDHKLGSVHAIPVFHNPNSGNTLRAFCWFPDWAVLAEWYVNTGISLPFQVGRHSDEFE